MIISLLLSVGRALAYEEITVSDGGTLTGTVTLVGQVPKPKGYNLVTFPDPVYCGRISDGKGWRLLQTFHVGPESAFSDVVVLIEGVERGKPFAFQTPRVEAIDCTFKPFTTVVRDKHPVMVVNMDPAMHDIQAYETSELGPRVLFNVPLPMNPLHPRDASLNAQYHKHLPGEPMKQIVNMTKGRRVFVMQCGFHAYMESWGLAVENPYYAVTGQDGSFTISDIPPGTYRVLVWHPQIGGAKEYTVTIEPKGHATLNARIDAPTGRLYANEAVENPRFGLGIMGNTRIVPTLERQSY
ncbi:MAG: carboxypeptidase regulatory-like domain-containing protein [Nitrospirae bacterium]|nr:carboxypeptidase regulatory-like domain-containing protein [Nitrospirota bacterium]